MNGVIKVCGVTNERDAQVAIDAGADALGFNFWPRSPRYVTRQDWMWSLPVLKIGIFVGELGETEGLDAAQIYGDFPCAIRVWKAIKPGEPRLPGPDAFVMDVSEGAGRTFDWTLAAGAQEKIVLAGGLDGSNVAEAIRTARPWGVDACSRLEAAPGLKDPGKVRDFVTAAREEFQRQGLSQPQGLSL
jgi:phosphoribosylanthranilate isomerase